MPMPRWDRFRVTQRDENSSVWHISSPLSQPKTQGRESPGICGGSEHYSYSISGGAASNIPVPEIHFSNCHQDYCDRPPLHASSGKSQRPARSPYLQPPSQAATFAARQLRNDVRYSDANGVSPPSSPDPLTPKDSDHIPGDVSPIDELPELSELTMNDPLPQQPTAAPGHPRSNIPTMRRERRRASDAQKSSIRDTKSNETTPSKVPRPYGKDVRWDPRTGEPTTSDKGRKSQIDPHEYVQGISSRTAKPLLPSQIKKSQETSPKAFRDRPAPAREPTETPSPPPSSSKPQWRGASGRTSLIPPVNDTPAPPLILPRKSSKRTPQKPNATSDMSPLNLTTQTGTPQSPITRKETSRAAQKVDSPGAQAYPSPPFSEGHASPVNQASPSPQSHQPPAQSLRESLHIPSNDKATRRKPAAGSGHQPHVSTSSSIYSQPDVPAQLASAPAARPITQGIHAEDWVQPPSRFSITTYATSNAESPRQSIYEDIPPVPTPPQEFQTSMLDRKRPIVSGYENTPRCSPTDDVVKIDLDSSHYETKPAEGPGKRGPGPATDSTSLDKNLPLAPPEMETGADRVALLNARLSTLGNRRINLNTAIRQMTELMPTDHVLASDAVLRKREAEKKKVDALRLELAEVERETYDLGLKLHRAYKRLEREAEYEPTTLWVRRCTG